MSLRVAFDMDGTVADMATVLRREARQLFADAIPPEPDETGSRAAAAGVTDAVVDAEPSGPPLPDAWSLTRDQEARLWQHVQGIEDFWTTLPEQEPGIIARLAETAHRRRWEVLFITTRPPSAGDTTQRQTQRWLERHGFALPSVFVIQRSRGKLAEALHLDAVVDDRPENCLDVALDSQARPLLIWPGDPEAVPGGLTRLGVRAVPTPTRALDLLERLDDRRRHPKMVRSIRKMLSMDDLDRL